MAKFVNEHITVYCLWLKMYADNPKDTNKAQRKEKTHGIVTASFLEIQKISLHIILSQSEILEL